VLPDRLGHALYGAAGIQPAVVTDGGGLLIVVLLVSSARFRTRWSSFGPEPTRLEDHMASTQTEVRTLLDRRSEAALEKDLDRLVSLYAPDVVYFDVVPGLQYRGSAVLRDRFAGWFDAFVGPITINLRDVTILDSGDLAVAHMLNQTSGTLANGQTVSYWVRATVCCRRSPGGWVITHEHVSLPVDVASGRAVMDLTPG
jgi:uncharacterized protein (TIGR02246 family)